MPLTVHQSSSIPRAAELFARAVADRIDAAGLLCFSDRQRLLRLAAMLGIKRFDANLVIASVQNRFEETRREPRPLESGDASNWTRKTLLCALFVQFAICAGAWWGLAS